MSAILLEYLSTSSPKPQNKKSIYSMQELSGLSWATLMPDSGSSDSRSKFQGDQRTELDQCVFRNEKRTALGTLFGMHIAPATFSVADDRPLNNSSHYPSNLTMDI